MSERLNFAELKNEDNLVYFLEQVWRVGFLTARMNPKLSQREATEKFMPDFKEELSE